MVEIHHVFTFIMGSQKLVVAVHTKNWYEVGRMMDSRSGYNDRKTAQTMF
jgi:hypothetical protein